MFRQLSRERLQSVFATCVCTMVIRIQNVFRVTGGRRRRRAAPCRAVRRVQNLNKTEVSRQRNNNDDGHNNKPQQFHPHDYIYLERVCTHITTKLPVVPAHVAASVNKLLILQYSRGDCV